ncbi:MAG: hypothetical protein ACPGVJ_11825, partial [Mangrovicoccus sp.]
MADGTTIEISINLTAALVTIAVPAFSLIFWLIRSEICREESRLYHIFFRQDRISGAYHDILRAVLNRLDCWLTPEDILRSTEPTDRQRAWNWKSYDRMLLLAVIYPFALPIL